jgi:uncharacterized membrane protein
MNHTSTLFTCAATACAAHTALASSAGIPTAYNIVDLTELAQPLGVAQAEARAINSAGQVVGFEVIEPFIERAIFWDADGTAQIIDRLPNDNSNQAVGIGPDGTVLGISAHVTFIPHGGWTEIQMDMKATGWNNGVLTNMNDLITGGPECTLTFARAMNDAGQIVGWSEPPGHEHPPWWPNGFLMSTDGTITDLGLLENPMALNNNGQIVGNNISIQQATAGLWDNGDWIWLHDHPMINGPHSEAWDINDDGLIVGLAQLELFLSEEPIAWINNEPVKMIADVARPAGLATAVNSAGQAVGHFIDTNNPGCDGVPFIWQNGQYTDLMQFLPPEFGWLEIIPFDINDSGQIVGLGFRAGFNGGRAFLMTPIVNCPADVNGDNVVNVLDLLDVLAAWGATGGVEDINGDGIVDVLDLLELLAAWGPCA